MRVCTKPSTISVMVNTHGPKKKRHHARKHNHVTTQNNSIQEMKQAQSVDVMFVRVILIKRVVFPISLIEPRCTHTTYDQPRH